MIKEQYKQYSPASIKTSSIVRVKAIYPRDSNSKTVGLRMNRETAINLARNILLCATDTNTTGDVNITAYHNGKIVGVTTFKAYGSKIVLDIT